MERRFYKNTNLILVFCFVALLFSSLTIAANAENVNITPHKIILNAKGDFDAIKADVSIGIVGGSSIEEFGVTLWFDDIKIANAYAADYCVIDSILHLYFDRNYIQDHPEIGDFIGDEVTALVEGWVITYDANGDEIFTEFSGTDIIEILKPGKSE